MEYVIGIDIGTSATKTLLMSSDGTVAAQASREYPLYQPGNGWAEQDPEDWRRAVLETLKEVTEKSGAAKEEIKGIGFSGQMHGLVMLDEAGKPLRPSIIWCDQRSSAQVEEMLRLMPLDKWMEITANPPIAAWTAAKILWVKENEPELYGKCRHILLPKDYIRYILTGEFATDVSDASGMQLLDVKNRRWSQEVLNTLDIDPALLGRVYESQEVTGTLLPEIARACGLTPDVKVVAGAADNAAAAVGTGVVLDNEAFTTIGTSAIVYTHLDHFTRIPDGGLHVCCCAVPGGYFTMGGPQAAGLSLEWFKDAFCRDMEEEAKQKGTDIYTLINEAAAGIAPGSERLIYMPYLMGERTPHMNPKCRGAFVGLNTIHGKAHMLRAIMEGITYSLADCNNILKELGNTVTSMRVCGGGSKSRVWRQIMADLYECEIRVLKQEEGPAYGAAILAGVGAGVFDNVVDTCQRFISTSRAEMPVYWEVKRYRNYHRLYDRLYEDMKTDFGLLYDLESLEE